MKDTSVIELLLELETLQVHSYACKALSFWSRSAMKAIVLTCDKYHPFAQHMIQCYHELWPENPFVFRVASQSRPSHLEWYGKVEFITTPVDIKSTVLGLLDDICDEEFVYWCIDDKYPLELDVSAMADSISALASCSKEICGLLLSRVRNMRKHKHIGSMMWDDGRGRKYLQRVNYKQIWIHQFVRAKVIRSLFSQFPDVIRRAKDMDAFKDRASLPVDQLLFVGEENYCSFGESTSRGVVTSNCIDSFRVKGMAPPDWSTTAPWWSLGRKRSILIGS